jgi:tryptophan synthase alpha chain
MNGVEHIHQTFKALKLAGRAACMPYFTLGYPTPELSLEIIQSIARAGADLIELGVPFSDPLADGPTIQHSTQVALENGASVRGCLELVHTLRQQGAAQPLVLMSYINPLLAYGIERFCAEAASAGADGLIVPDLPPEEGEELEQACRKHGLAFVYLLAPTSTAERIALAAQRSSGFLYLVSVTGVTGARQALPPGLASFVARVRLATELPLAVGFGIATPQQATQVGRLADGVIVGSALINAVDQASDPCSAAGEYMRALAGALKIEAHAFDLELRC